MIKNIYINVFLFIEYMHYRNRLFNRSFEKGRYGNLVSSNSSKGAGDKIDRVLSNFGYNDNESVDDDVYVVTYSVREIKTPCDYGKRERRRKGLRRGF